MNDIVLLAAVLVPAVALIALRINAAMVFLSLCLGQVLVQFVAKDANSLIRFIAPQAGSVSESSLYLAMLFLPVVLTAIIMVFSVKGRMKVSLNALPAFGTGALAVLLAVPLSTPGLQHQIVALRFWHELHDAQAMIIGASTLVTLLFLWTQRRSSHREEKHGHHK
jgi:hypothetical protein